MFKLFKRNKNKKRLSPNVDEVPSNALSDVASGSTNLFEVKKKPTSYGKITLTGNVDKYRRKFDANDPFEAKNAKNEEREKNFAKIFFESHDEKAKANENANAIVIANEHENTSNPSTASDHLEAGKSGANFPNDRNGRETVSETKEERSKTFAKRPARRRKTFSFRRVDLDDGVNSIIEAVELEGNEKINDKGNNEESTTIPANHHDHHRDSRPDNDNDNDNDNGEHSSADDRPSFSTNERAEWSGRKSPEYSDVIRSDKSQSNVNRQQITASIGSNNNELISFKSKNNVVVGSSIGHGEAVETPQKRRDSFDGGQRRGDVVNSEVVLEIPKRKKAVHRRSYFERRNRNEHITEEHCEEETPELFDQVQQTDTETEREKEKEREKSQGPLKKGKKFLSSIFMARGRHQQSQRNHRNQVTQKSPSSSSSFKQLKEEPCSSKSHDQNSAAAAAAAVSADHKRRQIVTSNKNDSTISSSNTRNTQSLDMLRQHLETTSSSSPLVRQIDPAASLKMTLSNNSAKSVVVSRRDARDAPSRGGKSQQRSNSAELPREERANARNKQTAASYSDRACSEEPQGSAHERRWSGASVGSARVVPPLAKEEESLSKSTLSSDSVNDIGGNVSRLTHARNIEENVACAENTDTDCTVENTVEHIVSETIRTADDHVVVVDDECRDSVELTACTRHDPSESSQNQKHDDDDAEERGIRVDAISMGQTYGKKETSAEETRASASREFRDSIIPETGGTVNLERPTIVLPKITVEDCSSIDKESSTSPDSNDTPTDSETFFEFESENPKSPNHLNVTTSPPIESDSDSDDDDDHEEFHEQVANSQPSTAFANYRPHSPLLARHSPIQLEDVPEQEEDEALEEDDAVYHRSGSQSLSPDRFPLKSNDSTLSNSYPDSGISGCSEPRGSEGQATENMGFQRSTRSKLPSPLSQSQTQSNRNRHRSPFLRDSASTDCDETVLQSDDFDCFTSTSSQTSLSSATVCSTGDRLVCIESISLPDVVESTTSTPGSGSSGQIGSPATQASAGGAGEAVININGATGNTMGNVHLIPIHVEGERMTGGRQRSSSPKQRSIDDSVIGNGMKSMRFPHFIGDKPTIEVVEEDEPDNLEYVESNSEKLRFELEDQKSRLSAKLDVAQKNVQSLETMINDMQTKIVNLEQELSTKTWNVERLQSELNASQREDEFVRKKLRLLQEEKTELRHKFNESEDEYRRKYEDLESEYKELQEKYKTTQQLASSLHTQLAAAQNEAAEWRTEVEKIRCDLEEQIKILRTALENSEAERRICEDKWQKEYEMLRTQHMDREETLMTDCEWQMRQMQKQWKDKLDKSENERREAVDQAEMAELELETRNREVADLRHYEAEVKSLRGVVSEQQSSITVLMNKIEDLKADLQTATSKLEDQIEAVAKIKFQCDNAICDKERQMVYRIDEVRNEAASFWENKLYTEMTRLTHELESVYVDERREALDKLQIEHIEELRALTTRYTANEEELRAELVELQEKFDSKCQDFMDLRDKTDSTLLQTRMHLDRADRDYQNAMCREEERREALEESLRKEFETEKQEMELKFQERLNQVKEEFAIELQNSKQETITKYKNDLEQHKAKLRAEKDAAMQELAERYRQKLANAEDQMKEMELRHQRDLNELKASYDEDKVILDKRDMSNTNEIEQLHRRCRCLTNLFEEMRMRYERRDPRPEDLREIDELRARCESQERDLFTLTATLRELQMQQAEKAAGGKKGGKSIQKPPPKLIPTNCDVIYEENEERDSPPPAPLLVASNNTSESNDASDDDDDEDDDDDDGDEDDDGSVEKRNATKRGNNPPTNYKPTKVRNGVSSDF